MKDKKYQNLPLYNALRKYGFQTVKWEVLESLETIQEAEGIAMGYATGYTGGMAQASSRFVAPSLTGVVGNTLRASAQPAVEVATMTGAHALSEGRLPTMEDFAMNGIMVGGMRLGGFYTSKLAYTFQKTGTTPQSLIQFAKQNPGVKEDLMSGNMALPKEAGGNFQPLYLVRRNTPIPDAQTKALVGQAAEASKASKAAENVSPIAKVSDNICGP